MQTKLYPLFRRAWWRSKRYPAQGIAALLSESQWWSRARLERFRDDKFRRLVEHCYNNVPYYRRILDERQLTPRDFESASDLCKLPVLTKAIVRSNWNALQAKNMCSENTVLVQTGGSTGEPMKILKGLEEGAWADMCFERGISWGGLQPGMRHISFTAGSLNGSNKSWRQKISRRFAGQTTLLAYELRKDNVSEYLKVIRRSGAEFIVGYASNIYHLARLLLERGERLQLQAVFTTAERLLPSWATLMREAMTCKVYSYYGCGECNSLGYQCQEGDAYHIPEEHVILEADSDYAHSGSAVRGEALVTDLDNYVMPLLRYQNGDYVTIDDTQCSCRRSLGLISKLEGRNYEFLLTTSNERVSSGICDVILGNVGSVGEFQVRQDALDHIRILLVPCRSVADDEKDFIRRSFRHYLGETAEIAIQIVDEIPRTRAQKLRTAINEMLENSVD